MAKGSTLLHYVLGHATPKAQEAFDRIVAADKNSLINLLDRYHKRREDKGFLHDLFRGGKPADPLTMDPAEIERLARVYRDPDEQTLFDITLSPSEFEKPITDADIKHQVDRFYNENKRDFDSPDNLAYSVKNHWLHYEGRKDVAEQLLKLIGVKQSLIRPIVYKEESDESPVAPKGPQQDTQEFRIPMEQLDPVTAPEIKNGIRAWKTQYPDAPVPQIIVKSGKSILEFKGDRPHMEYFLNKLGISQNVIERILNSAKG